LFVKDYVLEPFPIAGGAVEANRNLDIGLNPAWRDAIVHFSIIPRNQQLLTTVAEVQKLYANVYVDVALLDPLSVNSAAYVNEGSYLETMWQNTYWGTNYPRLLEVKHRYDPNNTLWCFPCIESEVFELGPDQKLYYANRS
jgi:hypothetical protein